MIPPATSAGGARLLAEKVRRAIESPQIPHSGSPNSSVVTISIGGAVLVPDENGDANRLVQAADTGLYQAKRNGRNQVVMVKYFPRAAPAARHPPAPSANNARRRKNYLTP